MHHPWEWYPEWEESGAEYYNVTRGDPGFDDYVATLKAFYENSMRVPSMAGFAILSLFTGVVLAATLRRLINDFGFARRAAKRSGALKLWHASVSRAPLLGLRHARPVSLLGGSQFLTLKLPLRGETFLLVALAIVNIVPIVAFYTPYRKNNLYWPDGFEEMCRYVADRGGILATAQFPLVILLSGRNNPVTWATGATFETCMLYHRWIARWLFVQVLVHAIGYTVYAFHSGGAENYDEYFLDEYLRWGVVATVAFGPLIFLSLRWLRRKSYEIFVLIHVAMAVIAIVGTYYHIHLLNSDGSYDDFDNYMFASIAFYCIDKAARLARVLLYSVQVRPRVSVSTCTSDIISQTASHEEHQSIMLRHVVTLHGWAKPRVQSGSFMQLWIPRLQPFSSHPFTVADVQVDEMSATKTVYLYSKVHHGITETLHKRIIKQEDAASVRHVALVEGFYGHVPSAEKYARSLLVCGGIGITLCMPLLVAAKQAGRPVQLVWVIREESILAVASDVLSRHAIYDDDDEKVNAPQDSNVRLIVHVTGTQHVSSDEDSSQHVVDALPRVSAEATPGTAIGTPSISQSEEEKDKPKLAPTSTVTAVSTLQRAARRAGVTLEVNVDGVRPDLHQIIEAYAADKPLKSVSMGDPEANVAGANATDDLMVVSCGPTGFCDDVRRATNVLQLAYFEEAFEW